MLINFYQTFLNKTKKLFSGNDNADMLFANTNFGILYFCMPQKENANK